MDDYDLSMEDFVVPEPTIPLLCVDPHKPIFLVQGGETVAIITARGQEPEAPPETRDQMIDRLALEAHKRIRVATVNALSALDRHPVSRELENLRLKLDAKLLYTPEQNGHR